MNKEKYLIEYDKTASEHPYIIYIYQHNRLIMLDATETINTALWYIDEFKEKALTMHLTIKENKHKEFTLKALNRNHALKILSQLTENVPVESSIETWEIVNKENTNG